MAEQTRNLTALWQAQVAQTPEAIALIDAQGQQYTFAQMQDAIGRCAGYLRQHCQVQPGDGVLLLQPLSVQLYIALAAIWQLGAIAVLLNPLLGQSYIERCAQAINLKVWLGSPLLFATQILSRRLRQIPHKVAIGRPPYPGTTSWQQVQQYSPDSQVVHLTTDAIALLSFTSGTTGEPKPIRRSHGLLLAQHQALAPVLRWQPGAAELATLPLFGLANLVAGGTTVIPPVNVRRPARVSGATLRQTIQRYQIARLVAAPGILGQLIKDAQPKTLPILQQVFIGGAPVTQKLCDRLRCVAPQVQITRVYGSTEAEPIAVCPENRTVDPRNHPVEEGLKPSLAGYWSAQNAQPTAGSRMVSRTSAGQGNPAPTGDLGMDSGHPRGLLVGDPVPDIDLCILHPEAGQVALPNQPGEIIVRGAHVLNSPLPQHRVTFRGERWHRTGDLGYLDEQGRLWLLGRTTAVIRDDRGVLYPLAMEAMVNELPEVARSALVQWRGRRVLLMEWERENPRNFVGAGLKPAPTRDLMFGADFVVTQHNPLRCTAPFCGDTPQTGFTTAKLRTPGRETQPLRLVGAKLDHIVTVRHIPTDARHNAKVNYPRLERWLRSPWGRGELWLKTHPSHQD